MNVVQILTNWHPIIQGALGSGFFWVVMELGENLSRKVTAVLEKNRGSEDEPVHEAKYPDFEGAEESGFISLYSGLNYLSKGLIALTISLGLKGIVPIFSLIGFLVSVYFFFRSLSYMPRSKKKRKKA